MGGSNSKQVNANGRRGAPGSAPANNANAAPRQPTRPPATTFAPVDEMKTSNEPPKGEALHFCMTRGEGMMDPVAASNLLVGGIPSVVVKERVVKPERYDGPQRDTWQDWTTSDAYDDECNDTDPWGERSKPSIDALRSMDRTRRSGQWSRRTSVDRRDSDGASFDSQRPNNDSAEEGVGNRRRGSRRSSRGAGPSRDRRRGGEFGARPSVDWVRTS
mmetsp:Transcript_24247/g.76294  ORF Transcript_24247/g.76294 Transcript_24247/m.76294 type:complete len:217 (-) Transcript_24247:272-922(-)